MARSAAPPVPPAPHRVVILALPGCIPFELSMPARFFGRAWDARGEPLYTVTTCTPVPGRVPTEADFDLWVEHGPELLETADTVIVPAAYHPGVLFEEGRLPQELTGVFTRIRPGTRLASICTGGFFLAAAGLLDGRPATTHWSWADRFQRLFPSVRVDPQVLYVDDGDVLTSAGVAAGIDLCLHMIRRDHGAEVANDLARRSVVPPHREGGQAQFIQRPVPRPEIATTSAARHWALDRLGEPLQLRDLAERESMSVRTFTRRFREEVGVSPGQWLTQQRVERARQLLESTDLSVDQVARDAGFGTAQSMRQHLQSALGVAPTAYRRTFRASSGAAPE
ncbi:helix-turn-helix domain-containing protein [Streptomyces sp. NPDC000594]|uniref:GlxA family transcriptional regulator n=1 Tax=Streptomyces sp. NPDC000594 TaxID=3154261 RepID=UPI00333095D4